MDRFGNELWWGFYDLGLVVGGCCYLKCVVCFHWEGSDWGCKTVLYLKGLVQEQGKRIENNCIILVFSLPNKSTSRIS